MMPSADLEQVPPSPPAGIGDGNPAGMRGRVLAEAEIRWESLDEIAQRDHRADEAGRRAGGDLEHRIIARAAHHPAATELADALRHVRHAIGLAIMAGVVVAAVAGAAAARAALLTSGPEEPVNFFWAFATVLGVQSLILAVWIVLLILSLRQGAHAIPMASIGSLLVKLAQHVAGRIHRGPHHAAAIAAMSAVHLRGGIGRWTISSISNGLWLTFNLSCLTVLVLLLSARQYSFAWETTILSQETYVPLTRAVGALPRAAGFLTPDDGQVRMSQWTGAAMSQDADARQAWSSLLVGSLVIYGLAPRLLLLGLCLGRRRHACSAHRLDLTRPEFLRLAPRLMPVSQSIGVVDRDDPPPSTANGEASAAGRPAAPSRPLGPPAVVGFEITVPAGSGWPPAVHGVRWADLGIVDGRDDQQRVLDHLASGGTEPESLVIVCALTTTPDRGVRAFLGAARAALSRPPLLLLSGGESLRQRGDLHAVAQRIADWSQLAAHAGIDPSHILEMDLDHLTSASAARLAGAMRSDSAEPSARPRQIERAFDLIAQRAGQWIAAGRPPTPALAADLHREIAALYGSGHTSWRRLLRAPASIGPGLLEQVRAGSDRMVMLLPERLKRSPTWLAAGAAAGALGCIAAASFIAPVAIASLPMWSAIGAAVAAVMQPTRPAGSPPDPSAQADRAAAIANAVRAAALFAMLLELQGERETAITAILDRAVDERADAPLLGADSGEVLAWLDGQRHRFDLAVAAQAGQPVARGPAPEAA